jgi:membrane-associated phospholipid phosphatase
MIASLIESWKLFLSDSRQKKVVLSSLAITLLNVLLFGWFIRYNEHRIGYTFNEPLSAFILPAIDLTWYIFFITYGTIVLAVMYISIWPQLILRLIYAYNLLLIFRFLSIALFPLEPPKDMILMSDPFIETIVAHHEYIRKDLFFSGHTATIFLLAFLIPQKVIKYTLYLLAFIVGAMLVKQQVHYSFDVIAAPLFAYLCYYLSEWFWKKEIFQPLWLIKQKQ